MKLRRLRTVYETDRCIPRVGVVEKNKKKWRMEIEKPSLVPNSNICIERNLVTQTRNNGRNRLCNQILNEVNKTACKNWGSDDKLFKRNETPTMCVFAENRFTTITIKSSNKRSGSTCHTKMPFTKVFEGSLSGMAFSWNICAHALHQENHGFSLFMQIS